MTSLPPVISSNTIIKYFLPVLLHIVMPFVVVALIFFILRVACAYFLQGSRFLRVLVDGLIVLSFLVVAAIMVPIVFNTLKFPDAESAEAVNSDIDKAYDAYVDAFKEAMPSSSSSNNNPFPVPEIPEGNPFPVPEIPEGNPFPVPEIPEGNPFPVPGSSQN